MEHKTAALAVCDLWKSYRVRFKRHVVLRGLDLVASPGTTTAIVGSNGEGKTTLFRVLLGFLAADRGRCTIGGIEATQYRQANGIGYAPETLVFPRGWSGLDVLARGVDLLGLPACDRRSVLKTAVARTGLDQRTLAKAARLCSKGTQRRLLLAYALSGDPGVVVLDEPFSGLDPPARQVLRRQIGDAAARSATVLLSSHDLDEVRRVADAVYVLKEGRAALVSASDAGTDVSSSWFQGSTSSDPS